MGHVVCNLCGADDYSVIFPAGYAQLHQIVRCRRCGLMYANPQQQIDCDLFGSDPGTVAYDPDSPRDRQYRQKQLTQLPDNFRILRVLDQLFPHRGKLLEVGCFSGVFLDRIRADAWETTGLEPWPAVAEFGRRQYGLNIVQGVLSNAQFKEGEFDAVVLLHVIEHMPDPAADLREIRRILKPGGVLVVETPRFDSLMFRLLGRRERSIQNCQGHIFFFTEDSLSRLLKKCGLEPFRVERVGRTLTLDRVLYNLGLVTRSPSIQRFLAGAGRFLRLDRARVHLNFRDMQRIYARAV